MRQLNFCEIIKIEDVNSIMISQKDIVLSQPKACTNFETGNPASIKPIFPKTAQQA